MTIHDRYNEEKTISHGFADGLASWMTDGSTGGGTVTTETTMGGRAVLDTGATLGDYGRIDMGPFTPSPADRFDAMGVRFVYSFGSGSQLGGETITQLGMLNGDNLHRLYHQPNHARSGEAGVLRTSVSDTDSFYDTRTILPESGISSELIWDYSADELIHRYQDAYGTRVTGSSNLPDPTLDYTLKAQIQNETGDSNYQMYLYNVEIAYYNRPNR